MMKLYNLLFESISENQILNELKKMLYSDSRTGQFLQGLVHGSWPAMSQEDLVKDFYEKNITHFNQMLGGSETIKYLGAGAIGEAFDLGDKVLKIEKNDQATAHVASGRRAETAAGALFKTNKTPKTKLPQKPIDIALDRTVPMKENADDANIDNKLAPFVPMIYDQGEFVYPQNSPESRSFSWALMEKFQPLDNKNKDLFDRLLDNLLSRFEKKENHNEIKNQKNLDPKTQDIANELASNLRLASNWFEQLVQGMSELGQNNIIDFHPGNVGVRRNGTEGTLVFFD